MSDSKYKKKKTLEDGSTVYEYSDKQIQKRDRDKAERLQKLDKGIDSFRKKFKKDLDSDDTKEQMTALAVALMDETYSRVGNLESAGEGHFGTTTWRKKHVSFSDGKAKIKYVGKSGVKQNKTVADAKLVKALKDLVKDLGDDDPIFECDNGDDDKVCVRSEDVNKYLKEFDITAKDIRGYHANQMMRDALKEARKGKLPEDKKEREEKLKEEFDKALEKVSGEVGHEADTLKNNYLVPALAAKYLKDGTIIDKLDAKKSSVHKQVAMSHAVATSYLRTIMAEDMDDLAPRELQKKIMRKWPEFQQVSTLSIGTHPHTSPPGNMSIDMTKSNRPGKVTWHFIGYVGTGEKDQYGIAKNDHIERVVEDWNGVETFVRDLKRKAKRYQR